MISMRVCLVMRGAPGSSGGAEVWACVGASAGWVCADGVAVSGGGADCAQIDTGALEIRRTKTRRKEANSRDVRQRRSIKHPGQLSALYAVGSLMLKSYGGEA